MEQLAEAVRILLNEAPRLELTCAADSVHPTTMPRSALV